jgi:hypothetical protein
MNDSAPSDFCSLITRQVFRVDPWIQRAFEAQAPQTADEGSGLQPHVPVPEESVAWCNPTRIIPMTTARWYHWTDLPDKARSVVSTAEPDRDIRRNWGARHDNGIPPSAIQLPSRMCVILVTAPELVAASGSAITLL